MKMKKIAYSILAVAALFAASSCEKNLDIDQKGVVPIENFYQTDEDAEQAMVAAYAQFVSNVCSQNGGSIYAPFHMAFNCCADDMYAAGEYYGDNDQFPQMNEFRYDADNVVIVNAYKNIFLAMYPINLVIDHFKDGLPGSNVKTATTKRVVAEARVLRAYLHMMLAIGWNNPPLVDHVLAGSDLPYNCDKDPVNPMSHNELLEWCAKECDEAAADLLERASVNDKDGVVKVRKGFAYAVAGKSLLFAGKYAEAKAEFQKVIDSQKYELVPADRYAENFHVEGDCNEEKIFEGNIEFRADAWGTGLIWRSTWMEANVWGWRGDHFKLNPVLAYTSIDGWGGCGVPAWFSKAMLDNDGQSARFKTCFMPIDTLVYSTVYGMPEVDKMTLEEKKASKAIGIEKGLYGQTYYLPYKQLTAIRDLDKPGSNIRMNNFTIMRYAEVLLMQAECCLQTGDKPGALKYINLIQKHAGSKTISTEATMDVLKKEKEFEMWLEGCRWPDMVRWGDFARAKDAGKTIPLMYDKLFRPAHPTEWVDESGTKQPADENITWLDADKRFYTVDTHGPANQGATFGFKENKHEYFPFPGSDVIAKNPNITQNKGWN